MFKTFRQIEEEHLRFFPIPDRTVLGVRNIDCIHPLKQKTVANIVRAIQSDLCLFKNIEAMWVFGSSVNNCCNIRSDLDIVIELEESLEKKAKTLTGLLRETTKEQDEAEDIMGIISRKIHRLSDKNGLDLLWKHEIIPNRQLYINIERDGRLVYERTSGKHADVVRNGKR